MPESPYPYIFLFWKKDSSLWEFLILWEDFVLHHSLQFTAFLWLAYSSREFRNGSSFGIFCYVTCFETFSPSCSFILTLFWFVLKCQWLISIVWKHAKRRYTIPFFIASGRIRRWIGKCITAIDDESGKEFYWFTNFIGFLRFLIYDSTKKKTVSQTSLSGVKWQLPPEIWMSFGQDWKDF